MGKDIVKIVMVILSVIVVYLVFNNSTASLGLTSTALGFVTEETKALQGR